MDPILLKRITLVTTCSILFVLFGFLPLVVVSSLENGTVSGKFLVFSYAASILIILYSIRLFFFTSRIAISLPDVLITILIGYILINRFFFQSYVGFSIRFLELIGLSTTYIVLRKSDSRSHTYILIAVIIGGIVEALVGGLQLHGFLNSNHNFFKVTGDFSNPGPYAGYLASVFPVALGIYLFKDKINVSNQLMSKTIILLSLAGIGFILLLIYPIESRSAWIAIFISTVYISFSRYGFGDKIVNLLNTPLKKAFVLIGICTLLFLTSFCLYYFKQDSADGRLLIWKVTINVIKSKPWLGQGFDNFQANYMTYQAQYFLTPNTNGAYYASDVNYAFNEFLQFIAENGILAGILLLSILLSLFTARSNPVTIICKAGLISITVFSLFSYPSQILPIKLNAVLYLTILVSTFSPIGIIKIFKKNKLKYLFGAKTIFLLIATGFLYFIGQNLLNLSNGFSHWKNASFSYQQNDYQQSIIEYKQAYVEFRDNGTFLMQYGKALSMVGDHHDAIRILNHAQLFLNNSVIETSLGDSYKATTQYQLAERAYLSASNMCPDRFYPQYLLAILYYDTHQRQKALVIAKRLLSKDIKVQSSAIKEILEKMQVIINEYH